MRRTKRRKVSDGGEGDTPASVDRLSDLPDSILCHILSFLRTETSIGTSILARRWRFVWKYVPNLYFYRENVDIINRVLLLHKLPSINTLRLHLDLDDDNCSEYLMESWIIDAVARNVRNLDITDFYEKKLPLHLFTCETLVHLRLDCCCIIPTAKTVWLPRLKKLNLSIVQFEADESLPRLLSGCPVLEYLLVTLQISDREMVFCNISSLTVKRLEVSLVDDNSPGTYLHEYRLKIDTPALVYLKIDDCLTGHIESVMMTSLTQANIRLGNDKEKGDEFVYSQSVLEFVNRLCNVKRLRLVLTDSTKIIDSGLSVATVSFHNLTELMLAADGLFLSKFLENADNLEILMFSEVCDEGGRAWLEPEQVPTCLSSHLRFVKMFDYGTSSEFEIVRYLLRNARVLERIEISYRADFEGKNWLIEEISKIEPGSKACVLAFV